MTEVEKVLLGIMPTEEICFIDARIEDQLYESDLSEIKETKYYSVGYLVGENDSQIFLAQSILPKSDNHDETIYRRVLIIPKVSVVSRRTLKLRKENNTIRVSL